MVVEDINADIIKQILALAEFWNKIDYIYIFGSSLEERCTKESDIDIAIISNINI
ncbi:MAG: nucleotidyltransferase domain-containing protein [Lachnospiraceae bacterium]